MKEETKKNLLIGAGGAAVGAAGAVGVNELVDYIKEKNSKSEDVDDDENEVAQQEVNHDDEEVAEDDIVTTDNIVAQNEDPDHIVPVDSGDMVQTDVTDTVELAVNDVNPDEIAQELIAEPIEDDSLMAIHEGPIEGEVEAYFEDTETIGEEVADGMPEMEIEPIEEIDVEDGLVDLSESINGEDLVDEEEDVDFDIDVEADDADMMADMVDDI